MLGLSAARRPAGFISPRDIFKQWDAAQLRLLGWPAPQATETLMPYVSDWTVLGIPAAWRCATLIADTVGGLPIYAYSPLPDGSEARLDPTPSMLSDPWPLITRQDWTSGIVFSLLLRGNAYALPADPDPATGWPRQLVLLNPDQVWVEVEEATGLPIYTIDQSQLGPGEIMHVRGITPPGSPVGIGVLEAHRTGFQTMLNMEDWQSQAFTAGVPSGILQVDRPELGDEQAADLKARWLAAFNGRREPAVIPRSLQFTPLSFTPEDMAYVEAKRMGATEVCWIFGVHPNVIGAPAGNSMTYQNLEAASIDFARYSLTPWSARIEQTLSKWTPRSFTVRFEYGGLLRGTTLERYQAHEIALRTGLETLNEARDLEHRPRYPDPAADQPAGMPAAQPEETPALTVIEGAG